MEIVYISLENFYKIDPQIPKTELRKIQHEAGRFVLKFAAEKLYNLSNSEVILKGKKPQFLSENLKFSISHSDKICAVVFDENECALDLELIAFRDLKKLEKRYKKNFSSLENFYEFWTTYEAQIKLGKKIFDKKSFVFLNEYFMTAASEKKIEKISFFEILQDENSQAKIKQKYF